MIRNIFIFLLIGSLLTGVFSCKQGSNVSTPDYIIPDDTLIAIIADIHLADAYMSVRRSDKLEFGKTDLYYSVLETYNIERSRFDTTIQYYTDHPDMYLTIYDEVLTRISTIETDYISKDKEKRDKTLDSLSINKVLNQEKIDSAVQESNAFIEKANERLKNKEDKKRRAKQKAPKL